MIEKSILEQIKNVTTSSENQLLIVTCYSIFYISARAYIKCQSENYFLNQLTWHVDNYISRENTIFIEFEEHKYFLLWINGTLWPLLCEFLINKRFFNFSCFSRSIKSSNLLYQMVRNCMSSMIDLHLL